MAKLSKRKLSEKTDPSFTLFSPVWSELLSGVADIAKARSDYARDISLKVENAFYKRTEGDPEWAKAKQNSYFGPFIKSTKIYSEKISKLRKAEVAGKQGKLDKAMADVCELKPAWEREASGVIDVVSFLI